MKHLVPYARSVPDTLGHNGLRVGGAQADRTRDLRERWSLPPKRLPAGGVGPRSRPAIRYWSRPPTPELHTTVS
eukprot:3588968-Rhodomonas_salina.2